jgi:Tetrapyrrole (Corrin/Porphyrin) Methylases
MFPPIWCRASGHSGTLQNNINWQSSSFDALATPFILVDLDSYNVSCLLVAELQGVSAAFSAPLLANIPVTHRGVSNQVVMCTGYGREGTSPDLIQYHKEQTVVFLMAVGRLKELCQRLIEKANYPSNTPVAVVERAGCPDQRTVVGTMLTIADLTVQHNIQPPSTIVVGDVVNVLLEPACMDGSSISLGGTSNGQISGLVQNFTATASTLM